MKMIMDYLYIRLANLHLRLGRVERDIMDGIDEEKPKYKELKKLFREFRIVKLRIRILKSIIR